MQLRCLLSRHQVWLLLIHDKRSCHLSSHSGIRALANGLASVATSRDVYLMAFDALQDRVSIFNGLSLLLELFHALFLCLLLFGFDLFLIFDEAVVLEGDRGYDNNGQGRVHEDYDDVELPERARFDRLFEPPNRSCAYLALEAES